MNHVYHYYAFKDLGSRRLDMDGIVTLAKRVTDLDDFRLIKRTVAEFNHVTIDGVHACELELPGRIRPALNSGNGVSSYVPSRRRHRQDAVPPVLPASGRQVRPYC